MNQSSEESSSSSDTELETEKEEPVCALSPTIYSRDEGSADVTESPAFQYLDELLSDGKITDDRVDELKEKYIHLHKTVISLQESEIQLLQEAKRLSVELEQQQHELEKAEQLPEESSSEISQIRQKLLSCQNEYDAVKEREYEIQFKLECLQEEKRLLKDEYGRVPSQCESDKNKQLKENYDELCKEVIQRKAEINAIKEDISSKQKLMLIDQKETEKLLEKQANLKDELVKILDVPAQLGKETESVSMEKNDAEKKTEALNNQIEEFTGTLKAIEKRTEEVFQEKKDVMKELDEKQMLLERKEQECVALTKLLEISREKELEVVSDREALKHNIDKCVLEKKKQQDVLNHKQTQKDKELKNLKRMELQQSMIYDSLKQAKMHHKRLKLEVEAIPKMNGELLARRRELQKEIEMIKRRLAQQEKMAGKDARILEECIAEEGQLFKQQEKYRDELSRLAHLMQLRVEEREQKVRNVQKAQTQLQNIIKEIKRKDFEIREYKKRERKIQNELQAFSKMSDIIQNERNKCIHLAHAAHQKANDIKNRLKLLGNETENLRNTLITKERELQKRRLKNTNNVSITDSLRRDYFKIEKIIQEMKEKKQQRCLDLERLAHTITSIEGEIVQLCKKYERAIQQQNERGLRLRDREEELCILYEKIKIQEMLCRNGDIEVQAMDEKIRFLKLEVAEEKRRIKLWSKVLPVKNALNAHLVVLQIQYSQCKDRIKRLEEIFADPTKESRMRDLGGKDPSPPELLKKIEQLEVELLKKEEKLLETDCLYEHVSRMTDRIHAMAKNGKQDTLLLAKRISELQKKVKDRNRKMMALVAELSMKQALTIKLQHEMRGKEQFLITVSSRIDQGLPPPRETENEWLKTLRNKKMQKEAAEARAQRAAEEEQAAGPSWVHTTAEQRPNAYIPDDAFSLPLPRPYGALAPFKPSEPGSNMRHFRKPFLKPIEF